MKSWAKKILFILVGGGAVLGAPIVPVENEWLYSYETPLFDTQSGWLEVGQYAEVETGRGFYLCEFPEDCEFGSKLRESDNRADVARLQQVNIIGRQYVDVFRQNNEVKFVQTTEEEYDSLRDVQGKAQPRNTGLQPVFRTIPAFAAISLDNSATSIVSTASSISFGYTVSGTGRALLVGAAGSANEGCGALQQADSVTYNAVSLTFEGRNCDSDAGDDSMAEMFSLAAPATGSNTVVVDYGATTISTIAVVVSSFNGVDQTDPTEAVNTRTLADSAPSLTVTTVTDGAWVVDFVGTDSNDTFTVGVGQTELGQTSNTTGGGASSYEIKATAGAVSMDWTITDSDWGMVGVSLKPIQLRLEAEVPSAVTDTTATIQGQLVIVDTAQDIGFRYGIDGTYTATTTTVSGTSSVGYFTEDLTGLTAFEEYFYQPYASSSDGITYAVDTGKFFTADLSTSTPVVAADNHHHDNSSFDSGTHATTTGDTTSLTLESQAGTAAVPVIEAYTETTVTAASTITMTAPSGITADELLIIIVGNDDSSADIGCTASGWTTEIEIGDGGSDAHLCVLWKIALGDEGNVTVSGDGSSNEWGGWYFRVSGASTTAPINVKHSELVGSNNTIALDSITTTATNTLAFYAVTFDGNDLLPASVSGGTWVEYDEYDAGGGSTGNAGAFGTTTVGSPGGTGIATVSTAAFDGISGAVFAIRPDRSTGSTYEDGNWTAPSWSLNSITNAGDTFIEFASTTPSDTTVTVKTAVNTSATVPPSDGSFTTVTSGGSIAGISTNDDLTGKYLWTRVYLTASTDAADTPSLTQIIWGVNAASTPPVAPASKRIRTWISN